MIKVGINDTDYHYYVEVTRDRSGKDNPKTEMSGTDDKEKAYKFFMNNNYYKSWFCVWGSYVDRDKKEVNDYIYTAIRENGDLTQEIPAGKGSPFNVWSKGLLVDYQEIAPHV